MSDEARVQSLLTIRKVDASGRVLIDYRHGGGTFTADVGGLVGPTPGSFVVSVSGTDVDLSRLAAPGGLCRLVNNDPTNFVTVGVYEPGTDEFYPVLELLPGEGYVVRLSRSALRESTGTGTLPGGYDSKLQLRANAAPVVVSVEAFDA
jgi:hypothetical protein